MSTDNVVPINANVVRDPKYLEFEAWLDAQDAWLAALLDKQNTASDLASSVRETARNLLVDCAFPGLNKPALEMLPRVFRLLIDRAEAYAGQRQAVAAGGVPR